MRETPSGNKENTEQEKTEYGVNKKEADVFNSLYSNTPQSIENNPATQQKKNTLRAKTSTCNSEITQNNGFKKFLPMFYVLGIVIIAILLYSFFFGSTIPPDNKISLLTNEKSLPIKAITVSGNNSVIALDSEGILRFYNQTTSFQNTNVTWHSDQGNYKNVAISSNGDLFIASDNQGNISLFDLSTEPAVLPLYPKNISSVQGKNGIIAIYSKENISLFAIEKSPGDISVYSFSKGESIHSKSNLNIAATNNKVISFNNSGCLLIINSTQIEKYDINQTNPVERQNIDLQNPRSLIENNRNEYIIAELIGKKIVISKINISELVNTTIDLSSEDGEPVFSLSPNGDFLVIGNAAGEIYLSKISWPEKSKPSFPLLPLLGIIVVCILFGAVILYYKPWDLKPFFVIEIPSVHEGIDNRFSVVLTINSPFHSINCHVSLDNKVVGGITQSGAYSFQLKKLNEGLHEVAISGQIKKLPFYGIIPIHVSQQFKIIPKTKENIVVVPSTINEIVIPEMPKLQNVMHVVTYPQSVKRGGSGNIAVHVTNMLDQPVIIGGKALQVNESTIIEYIINSSTTGLKSEDWVIEYSLKNGKTSKIQFTLTYRVE
jgi:WD40 repeat protein